MNEQTRGERIADLMDKVHMSGKCQQFLDSEVGKHLLKRALCEETDAKNELVTCNPTDAEAISKLQQKSQIPNLLFKWIAEAIMIGEQAKIIVEEETNDGHYHG